MVDPGRSPERSRLRSPAALCRGSAPLLLVAALIPRWELPPRTAVPAADDDDRERARLLTVLPARRPYGSPGGDAPVGAEGRAVHRSSSRPRPIPHEARRRAEQANLAKSRFLATMRTAAHSRSTPPILGFCEGMRTRVSARNAADFLTGLLAGHPASGQHLLNYQRDLDFADRGGPLRAERGGAGRSPYVIDD